MISAFGIEHGDVSKGLGSGKIGSQSAVRLRALGHAARRNYLNDPIMADEAAKVPEGQLRGSRYAAARLENHSMRGYRPSPGRNDVYSRMQASNKQLMAGAANPKSKRRRLP